jgi:hypothetical protein
MVRQKPYADLHHWSLKHPNKSARSNWLKAVEFREPDWIPCSIGFFPIVWARHRERLTALQEKHPFLFGTFVNKHRNYDNIPMHHQPNTRYTDNWGCRWYVSQGGYEGQVEGNPLADWSAFASYRPPDPLKFSERGKRVWFGAKTGYKIARKYDILTSGSGERLFDRLYFLRGFDNLMMDFARNDPHLPQLIQMLQDHEITLTKKWLQIGVDVMNYHTDIGTQDRLMISPRQFRKYIKPMFAAIFQPCRQAKTHVYLSSDGYLLDIVDDLKEAGVSVHDPQLRANTLEGIAKHYKGKLCVDLDLDRQSFTFATPDALKKQIRDAVATLNSPEGGFMMKVEISDVNVPFENIEALCEALEEYSIPKR